jgi:hypothetical protein
VAIRNTSIVPFKVNNIPDRFTPVFATDDTVVTTTAGTGAVKRLNRLQTGTFRMATNVIEVTEMGSQFRPGGIDDLGEATFQLSWASVGIGNIATLTGTPVLTTPGAQTQIGQAQINAATVDLIRLVADSTGNVFGTLYLQDCVLEDYGPDAREKQLVMESVSGKGPNATFFPGFVVPKVIKPLAADVTAGYITITPVLGADESPVQIFTPGVGQVPSYWSQYGANFFLKIEKVPGALLTAAPVRYAEQVTSTVQTAIVVGTAYSTPSSFIPNATQAGQKVTVGLGSANQETVTILAIGSAVSTTAAAAVAAPGVSTVTPGSMLGIQVGVALHCVNAAGTASETVSVTAVTSTTFTATFASAKAINFLISTNAPSFQAAFTKAHAVNDIVCGALLPSNGGVGGTAAFLPTGNKLFIGDAFTVADAFRLTFLSYNTDSLPTTIPANTPDTTDRSAVSSRLTPLQINGLGTSRVQSASFKMTVKRDQTQGIGETSIAYGISSVPDVAISLDIKETDMTLLSQLSTGSKNLTSNGGTIANDFQDLNYLTRIQLSAAIPATITLNDPFDATKILCVWNCPQVVVKDIDYSSTQKADNAVKITAMDINGNMTVTYTAPA